MKIANLKPGMTVWDVGRQRMGNTTLRTVVVWPVKIESVDPEGRFVTASWNGNRPKTFGERQVKAWRRTEPVLIRTLMGRARLATREELAGIRALSVSAGEK